MGGLPWYRCNPAQFNDGMIGLTLTERGFYVTVLNCIYIEGGPVKDDPAYWAAMFGCAEVAWLEGRDALITKGKLFEATTAAGKRGLMNARAHDELAAQSAFRSDQAKRGSIGGSAKRKKSNRFKELQPHEASAKRVLSECLASAKPYKIEREIEIPYPSQEEATDSQDGATSAEVIPLVGRAAS